MTSASEDGPGAGSLEAARHERCPCGSGEPYAACCARAHRGEREPATAEELMRSRYAAFAVGDAAHLLRTWHPSTRPASLDLDDDLCWVRLDVEETAGGGPFETEGTVTFTAHWRRRPEAGPPPVGTARRGAQHERSRFVREGRRWSYVAAT